ANPPSWSSPACPGAWITPSRDTYSTTIKLLTTTPPARGRVRPADPRLPAPAAPARTLAEGPKLSAPTAVGPGRTAAEGPADSAALRCGLPARAHAGRMPYSAMTVLTWDESGPVAAACRAAK